MNIPDLRILALADAKLLPPDVQSAFDHWRIWNARDAITHAVRKRLLNVPVEALMLIQMYLERLEEADTEQTIFEGIYALASVVDVHRQYLALHSEYLVLIMSSHLNPWGLLEFQHDFEQPAQSTRNAAIELWRLAQQHSVDVPVLLAQRKGDPLLEALDTYYRAKSPQPSGEVRKESSAETGAGVPLPPA